MRVPIAILAVGAAIAAAGCGGNSGETPVACLNGPDAYLVALREAPAAVRLDGRVPIGDCLPENQQAGALTAVGAALVSTATRLNSEARAEPGAAANLQLGYLVGVAEERAEHTEGIHEELVRRLAAAARYSPGGRGLSPAFMRTYRRGRETGRTAG